MEITEVVLMKSTMSELRIKLRMRFDIFIEHTCRFHRFFIYFGFDLFLVIWGARTSIQGSDNIILRVILNIH